MRKRLIVLAALAVYMELVFHIYMGLDMEYAPLFLCAAAAWGFLASAAVSLLPERAGRIVGAILTLLMSVVYMAECICKQILQQYYQIVDGLDTAAGNHLGDYKDAVWQALRENMPGFFLLVALPLGVWFFTVSRTVEKEPGRRKVG